MEASLTKLDIWQGILTIRWQIKSKSGSKSKLWPVTNQQATLISFQVLPHRWWELTDRRSDCMHNWIGFNSEVLFMPGISWNIFLFYFKTYMLLLCYVMFDSMISRSPHESCVVVPGTLQNVRCHNHEWESILWKLACRDSPLLLGRLETST